MWRGGAGRTPFWGIPKWVGSFLQFTEPQMKPPRTPEYALFLVELRDARARANMTQVELAEALGHLQTYVSKSELGDRRLDVIELRRWLLALGCDPVRFAAKLEDRLARNTGGPSGGKVTLKRAPRKAVR